MRPLLACSTTLVAFALNACGGSSEGPGGGGNGTGGSSTTSSTTSTTLTLKEGECHDTNDCAQGSYCAYPGAPFCGGAGCALQPCSLDGDCANMSDPFVCEIDSCCGDKRCVHGCNAPTDCGEGQTCTPDFHCVPAACDAEPCPANFDCGMGAVPTCARRQCSSDAECDGYCVLGACYSTPGTCEMPSA